MAELGADDVGGEAGGEKGAVERGEFFFVERAARLRELALQARADERGFVGFGENGIERGFDVAVRDAADAELAGDAETSLAAGLRVAAGIVESEFSIVEIILLSEACYDRSDEIFLLGAALEILLHFMNGVRAAHQCTQSGGVEILLSGELARGGAHTGI